VLDFGKPVLLTDVIVPMCGDLASLSIDVWVESEETDGHRLVVSTDIGVCSLIMNDIMPPPVCRFLKVGLHADYQGGFPVNSSLIQVVFRSTQWQSKPNLTLTLTPCGFRGLE